MPKTRPIKAAAAKWVPQTNQQPAVNTAAVITLAALTKKGWAVSAVRWSYDGAPTGGKLTIAWTEDGSARSEVYYITAAGPGYLPMAHLFPKNAAVTITLAAAGAAVKGTVYADFQ